MFGRILVFSLILGFFSQELKATDLDHSVYGADDNEDILGSSTVVGSSPYIVEGEKEESVEKSAGGGEPDYHFSPHGEVTIKDAEKKEFEGIGYTLPGTFEKQENYIETDRAQMSKDFRKYSTSGINIAFIKNGYDYQSTNDIINRTIGEGYKSMKGGSGYFRHDSFVLRTMLLNLHWSIGMGVGFNTGKGIFSTGERSQTTINLWEVPIDGGLGMEVPISSWFKFAGTAGPSVLGLLQSRNDFQRGEKGKRKIQYSPGYFVNAQFKVNLAGFNPDTAYDLFTSSEITNLYMNLELRHQNYSNFQDPISISGTSFGVGFTFEYL